MNAQLNLPLIQNHCWNQVLSEFCMGFERSATKVPPIEEGWRQKLSVWWEKFIQFLAALAVLPLSIWKKRLNSSFSYK